MNNKPLYNTKKKIAITARSMFVEQGYTKTSINDIAIACGIKKTNVQRHYKKKEDFIVGFLKDILNFTDLYLADKQRKTDNFYINIYIIGQIHYAFLLTSQCMKKLTFDIVSDRYLTDIMISLDVEWAAVYMEKITPKLHADYKDYIYMIMGGAYELMYRYLASGKAISPQELQKKVMIMFLTSQGFLNIDAERLLNSYVLSDRDIKEAIEYLENNLIIDAS